MKKAREAWEFWEKKHEESEYELGRWRGLLAALVREESTVGDLIRAKEAIAADELKRRKKNEI